MITGSLRAADVPSQEESQGAGVAHCFISKQGFRVFWLAKEAFAV